MSNQQNPKQQNRPSLYDETRGTTSAFSILGAAQPLGWSKQKSIGLSIISFIAGSVLSGGAVGLMKSVDQPVSQTTELAASTHTYEVPKTTPVSAPKPITSLSITNQTPDMKVKNTLPISNQPVVKNPLASFKDDVAQKTAVSNSSIQSSHNSSVVASKDDAELQKLIERKTQHEYTAAKTNVANEKVENKQLEKKQVEQNKIVAEALGQKEKTNKEKTNASPHVAVSQKRPLAHDKDVLLVKSMLDTMDHPLTVNITTRAKTAEESH